jgi:hypothetical protein
MTTKLDDLTSNLFTSSRSDWSNKTFSENSRDDWLRAVVDGIDRLCCDGGVRDPEGSRTLVATTRSRARAPAETQAEAANRHFQFPMMLPLKRDRWFHREPRDLVSGVDNRGGLLATREREAQ